MSPLEQREGRSLWVMRGVMSVGAGGSARGRVHLCVRPSVCACVQEDSGRRKR